MSHLENLLHEYYLWQGYTVSRNKKVGRLTHGGYEGELDIVAYHPATRHLLHLEPSIDGHSWSTRESRDQKKFLAGKKYIFTDVFPWLTIASSRTSACDRLDSILLNMIRRGDNCYGCSGRG